MSKRIMGPGGGLKRNGEWALDGFDGWDELVFDFSVVGEGDCVPSCTALRYLMALGSSP